LSLWLPKTCVRVSSNVIYDMCGIGALLQPRGDCGVALAMLGDHLHLLARRGPDVQSTLHLPLQLHGAGTGASLCLHGSVLSMRGSLPVAQPLVSGRLDGLHARARFSLGVFTRLQFASALERRSV
jgi:hypothetical protein